MKFTKETLVTAFALFSMFFGAGNLILPPYLGFNAGESWNWVILGFAVSAVIIPILGIVAHARLQGTMLDFGNKVHPVFSLVYCILVYLISIALPAPRTASVTYEMGIVPYVDWSSLTFSTIYFGLVLVFALNRSQILDLLGKYLTPLLIMMLIMIIGVAAFGIFEDPTPGTLKNPFGEGLLEGYQTFDAIGAVVVGAVLVISLNLKNHNDYAHKKMLIAQGGILAGLGLLLIYAGLIYVGNLYSNVETISSRTDLLSYISYDTLGSGGRIMLSGLIGLACFTTAVGIVTGTADFVKGLLKNYKYAYLTTAILGCILGVAIGQFNVDYIIAIAVPALYFIYPVTIILILLNVIPQKFASPNVFRGVIITTMLFSIPDFINSIGVTNLNSLKEMLPLGNLGLAWLIPAVIIFIAVNVFEKLNSSTSKNEEA